MTHSGWLENTRKLFGPCWKFGHFISLKIVFIFIFGTYQTRSSEQARLYVKLHWNNLGARSVAQQFQSAKSEFGEPIFLHVSSIDLHNILNKINSRKLAAFTWNLSSALQIIHLLLDEFNQAIFAEIIFQNLEAILQKRLCQKWAQKHRQRFDHFEPYGEKSEKTQNTGQ